MQCSPLLKKETPSPSKKKPILVSDNKNKRFLVWIYGISTIDGYLMQKICFLHVY